MFLLLILISYSSASNLTEKASVCGKIFTQREFLLESEGWPDNYPTNQQCSYLFKGPACPTYYRINFLHFSLKDSLGCTKDRLEVENIDALCGVKKGVKTYFSKNGSLLVKFVSDHNKSAGGFKMLVSRSNCNLKFDSEEDGSKEEVTTPQNRAPKNYPNEITQCCSYNEFGKTRFFMTSPNFPYSTNQQSDCILQIRRANSKICRIRIIALLFYLNDNNSCEDSYLEIDGRQFCGCNMDLKLITTFDFGAVKNLRFFSKGLRKNSYTGFVLEVIQDECPKKYEPESNDNFRFYNDQVNRVAWPNNSKSFAEKFELIKEKTEVFDDNNNETENSKQIIKHIYVYQLPEYYNRLPVDPTGSREETTYIDTRSINFTPNQANIYQCTNWNRIQYNILYSRFGKNLFSCQTNPTHTPTSKKEDCVQLNYARGYFRSPYYPIYYPGNTNICYRFQMQSGFCGLKLHMQDFQLETSLNCQKDYLIFGNQLQNRYCGHSLHNTVSVIDMKDKDFIEMRFVADSYICGKGFAGIYEQIACHDMNFPINPVYPETTETPQTDPDMPCYQTTQEETFTIYFPQGTAKECTFYVPPTTWEVCRIELYFEQFNLDCSSELLVIDEKKYCGQLKGQTVTIETAVNGLTVVLKKYRSNYSMQLKIRGKKVRNNCPVVPAERILKNTNDRSIATNKYIISLLDKNFKDICGIVSNSSIPMRESFCDYFMTFNSTTDCRNIENKTFFIPTSPKKIELYVPNNISATMEVEFQEIDCENF